MPASPEMVIATRRIRLTRGRKASTLTVKIGRPRRVRTGEWACPYWISGLGDRITHKVRGIDAVQALVLALEAVRLELKKFGGRISWPGERGGGEFPQYVPTEWGPETTDRIEKFIRRELLRAATAEARQ